MAQAAVLGLLGLAGALLHTALKLRLGVPGHAALWWLVPVLIGRGVAPMAAAATVASTGLAVGLFAFGGFSLHWPLVLTFGTFWLVGPVLDLCVLFVAALGADGARAGLTGRWAWLLLPAAGVVGNFAHLVLKLGFGVMRPHAGELGLPAAAYTAASYLVFGLAAGSLAWAILGPARRDRRGA